jgi:hypothetical protein
MRGESVSSSSTTYNPNLHDSESAIDDDPSPSSATSFAAANHGHFARRVSFGARALQDIKGGASSSSSSSVPAGRPSATVAVAIPEEDVVVAAGEKKTLAPTSSSLGRRGLCLLLDGVSLPLFFFFLVSALTQHHLFLLSLIHLC